MTRQERWEVKELERMDEESVMIKEEKKRKEKIILVKIKEKEE